jgi:heavy metal translocating P-type ATPase
VTFGTGRARNARARWTNSTIEDRRSMDDHATRGRPPAGARVGKLAGSPVGFATAVLLGLGVGGGLWLGGARAGADVAWGITTGLAVVPAVAWVVGSLLRRRPGVDLIAVLALVGALVVGEYLAGAVISVMLATGRLLESRASRRAEQELRGLLDRAPRTVHRYVGGELTDPPLESVVPGDLLLVRAGEVVPVDGRLVDGGAVLDESALTGEALPVERGVGEEIPSGVVNAGPPFEMRATTLAAESTYAGIVRMVATARDDRAPMVRLADRYAAWFLPLACAAAGGAWLVSGELSRAVAVLVVATPCPLILAAPVAIVSGLSRAARRGVIVKGGGALEQLARARILLLDKTGTITRGRPSVTEVLVADERFDAAQVLRFAASLDQLSAHVLASAIVRAAQARGVVLASPESVEELPGAGVRGVVDGHRVSVGKAALAAGDRSSAWLRSAKRRAELDGSIVVFVGVDDEPVGAFLLDDPIRADANRTVRALRQSGLERVVMVTGDRVDVAEAVAAIADIDEVFAECSPADKVAVVRLESRNGATVMVGDGINDAPALAVAGVGVAIGARGATASSEAADVVLTVDRLDRLGDALRIARRAVRIARQSVIVGMGLSIVAMGVAAVGWLPAAWGALLQEGIDVAVILNALRVVTGPSEQLRLEAADAVVGRRFSDEHPRLQAELERLRDAADALRSEQPAIALAQVRTVNRFLVEELLPHEEAEDSELYPVLARVLGGHDSMGTMSRAHAEIGRLVRRLGRLLEALTDDDLQEEDVRELQGVLYGLYAVLRLHFAQENEGYFSLLDTEVG